MVNEKTISIIVPFYNGELFFEGLLQSLQKAILYVNNLHVKFEVIILIDSPTTNKTDLQSLVEKKLRGVVNKIIIELNSVNKGVANTRNYGLSICSGDFVHLIDQDDQLDETFYSEVISASKYSNFILINGKVKYSNSKYNEHLLYYFEPVINIKSLILDDFIRSPGQIVFEKSLIKAAYFPSTVNHQGADDKFFWVQIFFYSQGKIRLRYIKSPLYIAMIHGNNFSTDNMNLQLSCLENWKVLTQRINFGRYNLYIERNIKYVKYITNTSLGYKEWLDGLFEKLIYSLNANRIMRYIIKRF